MGSARRRHFLVPDWRLMRCALRPLRVRSGRRVAVSLGPLRARSGSKKNQRVACGSWTTTTQIVSETVLLRLTHILAGAQFEDLRTLPTWLSATLALRS